MLVRQGVQFGVLIVLTRLLTPEDFGLLAILTLFIGFASIFTDGGLSAALIQRQNSTPTDESSVFIFNIGMGALSTFLLCVSAPCLADFFEQPSLTPLTYTMAAVLFINACGAIHMTLLQRELNFRTIAQIGGTASLLSGLLATVLAAYGFGAWSLAAQAIASSAITTSLLWHLHPWRPTWKFSMSSLYLHFHFGAYEAAANITDVISNNLTSVLIGKLFSTHDAGLYDRAQRIQQIPANILTLILNRVAFPAFSRKNTDKTWLAHGLKRAQQLSMAIHLPATIALAVLAEPLLATLFGAQWTATAPVIQILAIAGLLWPLHTMNLSVLRAQGKAKTFFQITIFKKFFTIGLTLITCQFGIIAIAWSQAVASILAYLVNTYFSKRLLDYGALQQLRDLQGLFLASAPMVAVMLVIVAQNYAAATTLPLALISGTTVYWLTCRFLCRNTLDELLGLTAAKHLEKSRNKQNGNRT